MLEDSPTIVPIRVANSPNAFDLRRVGAHPDYWYPVAWSTELKEGKALGRHFAGEPIVIYRGKSGQVRIPLIVDKDSRPSWTMPRSRRRAPPAIFGYSR
jgi:hypothetical protein